MRILGDVAPFDVPIACDAKQKNTFFLQKKLV